MADLTHAEVIENTRYEVLTPAGFKAFEGLMVGQNTEKIRLQFDNGSHLICTPKHKIIVCKTTHTYHYAELLDLGDAVVFNTDGNDVLVHVICIDRFTDNNPVYEFLEVAAS